MGQSGGPTLDCDGAIWALQSRTMNHPLGFSPKVTHEGEDFKEHQFLNAGIGIHVAVLRAVFKYHDIDVGWVG